MTLFSIAEGHARTMGVGDRPAGDRAQDRGRGPATLLPPGTRGVPEDPGEGHAAVVPGVVDGEGIDHGGDAAGRGNGPECGDRGGGRPVEE